MNKVSLIIEIDGEWDAHKKRDLIESFSQFLTKNSTNILLGGMKNIIYHENKKSQGRWLIDACEETFDDLKQNISDKIPTHRGMIIVEYPFDSEKMVIKINTPLPQKIKNHAKKYYLKMIDNQDRSIFTKITRGYLNIKHGKEIVDQAKEISTDEYMNKFVDDIGSQWGLMIIMEFNNHSVKWFQENNLFDFKMKIKKDGKVSIINSEDLVGKGPVKEKDEQLLVKRKISP